MRHLATRDFWAAYEALPAQVRRLADSKYQHLKTYTSHTSLHFKRIGRFCSVRVGLHYRALAVDSPDGTVWFWIGSHADYDKLVGT